MEYIKRKVTLAGDTQEIISLQWASASNGVVALELHNESSINTTENKIGAVRGDLLEGDAPTGESEAVKNGVGAELCNERWLEVRLNSSDTWHAVDGYANTYDIGAINAGSSKTFEVRLNVPSDSVSIGTVTFAVRVLSR